MEYGVETPGTYSATVTNACGSNTDSITISNKPQISVNLGVNLGLCQGKSIVLNAANAGATYLWNTGATTQSITVTTPGNYTVGVNNGCGTVSDQISIYDGSFIVKAPDQIINLGSAAVLNAFGGNSYTWSTGQITPSITVSPISNTTYTVTATNIYGCQSVVQVSVIISGTLDSNTPDYESSSLQYYPNPVTDFLHVNYSETIKKVELYNLLGQSVLVVYPNELKTVLNINHLNAATYFMIVSTDTKRKVFKVIKK